jgi:hypothetical protein
MLYGSVTMGSCYLIAALCLRAGEEDPSKSKTVCSFIFWPSQVVADICRWER